MTDSRTATLLETDRLRLRQFTLDDVDLLVALDADPEVMRYVQRGKPTPVEAIRRKILPSFLRYYDQAKPIGFWATELRHTNEFIGWFHWRPDYFASEEMDLGYRLVRRVWGQGFATEGARALIAFGFKNNPELETVCARALIGNLASQRVMQKCGLTFAGEFTYPLARLPGWPEDERRAVKYAAKREHYARD